MISGWNCAVSILKRAKFGHSGRRSAIRNSVKVVLKQADKLNSEGYGVYFAPCLRQEKKGSAASAALLPALWVDIDCDGDQIKRDKGLAKLRDFDPAPSIIVDSGGGWHGYWLLDKPFMLETDEDKQRIATILHGLFSALDADESLCEVSGLRDAAARQHQHQTRAEECAGADRSTAIRIGVMR